MAPACASRVADVNRIKRRGNSADIFDMRTLFCFLIFTIGCRAQRPEDEVLAVYKQMEKAEQTGDANLWIGLWSREEVAHAESMRPYVRPRPDRHYTSSTVFVQGDVAALLGQMGKDEFVSMRFVRQDGLWKIKDQVFSNVPYSTDSVYARVPPPGGAFERAGAPWQNTAAAFSATEAVKRGWQARAAYDESFLYVQIECSGPIPAPGSTVERPPSGWPMMMKVALTGVGEFLLRVAADVGDQATFDKSGRANSHRAYVAYSQRLFQGDQTIFEATAGLDPSPLVLVGDRSFEVRIPLRTMGVTDVARTKITIGDAQWPKSAVFSVAAQQYR
jgi:hypothetical protein